jgi:hypothetical protein
LLLLLLNDCALLLLLAERTLESLRTALERKVGVNESPLSAIFLMNNFNYIHKTLKKSTVFANYISSGSVSRLEAQVHHHQSVYHQRYDTEAARLCNETDSTA